MEFQEVIKQFKRLCDSANQDCSACKLGNMSCSIKDIVDNSVEFEKRVMAWAAEHTEPVYPTFAEWMYDSFLKWCQGNYPGRAKDEKAWFDYIYETRIPADIAQKLGIEPKEG